MKSLAALLVIMAVMFSPALAEAVANLIPATPIFFLIAFAMLFMVIRFVWKEATR